MIQIREVPDRTMILDANEGEQTSDKCTHFEQMRRPGTIDTMQCHGGLQGDHKYRKD
jgi:hypothetical protein